jgi:hypothetical protein
MERMETHEASAALRHDRRRRDVRGCLWRVGRGLIEWAPGDHVRVVRHRRIRIHRQPRGIRQRIGPGVRQRIGPRVRERVDRRLRDDDRRVLDRLDIDDETFHVRERIEQQHGPGR